MPDPLRDVFLEAFDTPPPPALLAALNSTRPTGLALPLRLSVKEAAAYLRAVEKEHSSYRAKKPHPTDYDFLDGVMTGFAWGMDYALAHGRLGENRKENL